MSFVVSLVCLVTVLGRRRRRVTILVPAIVGALAAAGFVLLAIGLHQSHRAIASASAADNATILAAGISEAVNCFAAELLFEVPFLVGAYLLDRWLRRRQATA